eukprot:CAMPEP_0182428994 /NCGR_PEP_ID=MMETSP1167-20130531/25372_1 /TAXON_ID=2988 /ORGANISM="Mallomonas Sp, Strain CCMP3275" /LENGTH=100 /DNA_ID=CAMNT_0024612281 /DNA_START=87 /DNA_END=389 /DNA_ORIENTATION=+
MRALLFATLLAVGSSRQWLNVPNAFLRPTIADDTIKARAKECEGDIPTSSVPVVSAGEDIEELNADTTIGSIMKVIDPCAKKDSTVLGRYFGSMTPFGPF